MEVIKDLNMFDLPRSQIRSEIHLPDDLLCQIWLGETDVEDAPSLAVQMSFFTDEGEYEIVFLKEPPPAPLEEVAVSSQIIMDQVTEGTDGQRWLGKVLSVLTNRVYTKSAEVTISQIGRTLEIRLNIDGWEDRHHIDKERFRYALQI